MNDGKKLRLYSSDNSARLKKLIAAAVCLALCLILPLLVGQLQAAGNAFCPMHIPVLICGFVGGPLYAAIVGAAAPPLRFAMFGMPPLYPVGLAMCFELVAYGLAAGLIYRLLHRKTRYVYPSLISAMIIGRAVWGAAMLIISGVSKTDFTWSMFISGAVLNAIPGIITHIILIPAIVVALQKAGIPGDRRPEKRRYKF